MEFLYNKKDVEELAELMSAGEDAAEEVLRIAQDKGIAGPDAIRVFRVSIENLKKDLEEAHGQVPHDLTHGYPFGALTFHIEDGKAAVTGSDIKSDHVVLPSFVKDKYDNSVMVAEIGHVAFMGQQKLKYLVICDGVERIADAAFAYSGSLVDIVFPSTLKTLDAALWNVPQYEQNEGGVIYYAGTPEQFDELLGSSSSRVMMDYTPYQDIVRFIESVGAYQVPDIDFRIAYDEDDDEKANPFAQLRVCNLWGDVVVPEFVELEGKHLPVREIGRSSFSGNETVTSVVIPPSVKRICQDAFYGCTGLTGVDVRAGEDEIEIGTGAFYGCINLFDVHLRRKAKVEQYAFEGDPHVNVIEYC